MFFLCSFSFKWLDALGKWGLVDVYVLVLCMASFSFNIYPHEVNYLPDEFVRIQVIAEPRISIFLFIIALIVSLIATHIITHYHREEIQRKHLEDLPYDRERKLLLFNLPYAIVVFFLSFF